MNIYISDPNLGALVVLSHGILVALGKYLQRLVFHLCILFIHLVNVYRVPTVDLVVVLGTGSAVVNKRKSLSSLSIYSLGYGWNRP